MILVFNENNLQKGLTQNKKSKKSIQLYGNAKKRPRKLAYFYNNALNICFICRRMHSEDKNEPEERKTGKDWLEDQVSNFILK